MKINDENNDSSISFFQRLRNDEEARNEFVMQNQNLIYDQINKKFGHTPFEREDLFMFGMCGLIKAVDSFDPKTGYKFSTFAAPCITNAIIAYINSRNKCVRCESLEKEVSPSNGGKPLKLKDIIIDDEADVFENYWTEQLYKKVNKAIDELSPIDQTIIKMRFGFDDNERASFADIGRKCGVSRQYLNARYQKVMRSLTIKIKGDVNEPKEQVKCKKMKGPN